MAASWARARRSRLLGWLLLAILLGAASLTLPGRATPLSAHALLVRADPPVNSSLREPPTSLTLYFSEPLEPRFTNARVLNQDNERVDESSNIDPLDDMVLRVALKDIGPGYITVFWENVSTVDGHRITGNFPLTILNPDGSVPAGQPTEGGVSTSGAEAKPERVAVKWLLLVSGSLLAGTFAFMALVTPALPGEAGKRTRQAIEKRCLIAAGLALALLLPGGVAELALQASGLSVSMGDVLDIRWGDRWLLRNLILIQPIVVLGFCTLVPRFRQVAAFSGLLGTMAYLALVSSVSHAAAGEGAFWASASDFMHLLASSVWIGMLAMLVLLFAWVHNGLARGEKYPVLAAGLQRFSAVAVVSVALLLLTGVINSVIEVGSLSDLIYTGYGRALGLKLLLILPLLAMGALNAYIYRPELVDMAEEDARRTPALAELETDLFKTIRFELGIAVAVLAVVAVLVQISPTRGAITTQQAGKFIETRESNGLAATLVIDPNQPGINAFEVYLTGATDTVDTVRLNFSQSGNSDSEARLVMDASNPPSFYVAQGPYLGSPGKWTVGVDVRRTRGTDTLMNFSVAVGGATGETGGDFASPLTVSLASGLLLTGTALLAVGLVAGSFQPRDLTGGYVGLMVLHTYDRLTTRRMKPAWSLGLLVAVGIGIGVALGAHGHDRLSNEQATQGNAVPSSPESIARGQLLFMQNCIQCHGESGTGDGLLAPTLPVQPANLYLHVPYHPDQFFFSVITNGQGGGVMPAFGGAISEEDRWNIINYLRDRFGQAIPTQ